jgi:hypothetical protein
LTFGAKGAPTTLDRRRGRNVNRSAVCDLTLRHLSEDGREQRELVAKAAEAYAKLTSKPQRVIFP